MPATPRAVATATPAPVGTLALVAGLALLALLAGGCGLLESEPDEAREPSPDPPDAGTGGPSPAPDGEPDADADPDAAALEAAFDEIVEQVAELRGLPAESEVPLEVVDSDELSAKALDASDEGLERLEEIEGILAALHQIPADADLEALIEEVVSLAAVGLYDHEEGRAYLVGEGGELSPAERAVVAHEVVHALQDQHFGLDRLDELSDEPDAAMAFRSLVEGDAVVVQERWAETHLTDEEQEARRQEEAAVGLEQLGALEELPSAVVESFLAPYRLGPEFAGGLVAAGGWSALDEALADPPRTVAEVLDPELRARGFTPEPVDPGTAPSGWERSERLSWGAFEVLLLMDLAENHGRDRDTAAAWRGGELAAWRRGDDVAVGVAWTFEAPGPAATVCDAVVDWHATVAGSEPAGADRYESADDALMVDCRGDTVRFAVAPTASTAGEILGS